MITKFLFRVVDFINDRSPFYILSASEGGIGNCAEEIYHGHLYARRHGKKIIVLRSLGIFFGHPVACNKEIFRLRTAQSPKFLPSTVQFVGNLFVTLFFAHIPALVPYFKINATRVLKRLVSPKSRFVYRHYIHLIPSPRLGCDRIWSPPHSKTFSWEAADSVDWGKEYNDFLPLEISPSKVKFVEQQLRRMGIPPGAWFVCLHNREGGFKKDFTSCRNNSIATHIKGIKAITAAGGWVIRMGDRSMTPLPKMERVIDLPFTEFKSELMDMYLLRNCRFFVGHMSGIMSVAYMFQRPCVLVNLMDWVHYLPLKGSLSITKNVFSRKLNRYLSLKEFLEQPYSSQMLEATFDENNYVFTENTEDEIHDVIVEYLNQGANPEYSPLQMEFIEKRKKQIHWWIAEGQLKDDVDMMYRLASRTNHVYGTMSRGFLEKHWDASPLNAARHPVNQAAPVSGPR